jgi:tetratricopeptide (TPR) repeat protein
MRQKFAAIIMLIVLGIPSPALVDEKSAVTSIVIQIQRADYEGNRAELKRLYDELAPFVRNDAISSRVRYWRGFALWRRALNGFNDSVAPAELQRDLELAAHEFQEASIADPHFADAKVGQGSCLSNLIYLNRGNPSRLQELVSQSRQVLKEAESLAPDNPRLAWVLGPNLWYASQQNVENQGKAIEIYQRALQKIRKQKSAPSDPLEPSWGEPELLMNLAWSNLHRKTPDLQAARTDAQAALALVPYWHYVKDILIPQIQNAIDGTPPH